MPNRRTFSRIDEHRRLLLWVGWSSLAGIVLADAFIFRDLSLGTLYFIPILILSAFLPRRYLLVLCVVCAVLREAFEPDGPVLLRIPVMALAFAATAVFTSALAASRRLSARLYEDLQSEVQRRQRTESDLQLLAQTTPIGMLTVEGDGRISRANRAAEELLGFRPGQLPGEHIARWVPLLARMLQRPEPSFHSNAECSGFRRDGTSFLASVWFSREKTESADRLVVVMSDETDHHRLRRDEAMQAALNASRALVGAVAGEIRALNDAASNAFSDLLSPNIQLAPEMARNIANVLRQLHELSLRHDPRSLATAGPFPGPVSLSRVLTELRVLVEPMFRDLSAEVRWSVPEPIPLIRGSQDAVLQCLLMLLRETHRVLREQATPGWVRIGVEMGTGAVTVILTDSGEPAGSEELDASGLARPELLPVFLARSVLRSFGGDLVASSTPENNRQFAVSLQRITPTSDAGALSRTKTVGNAV